MSTAPIRDLVGRQGGMWCALGVVAELEGESAHWEVNDDGDLMVSVEMHEQGTPIWALVGALVGGNGKGVWSIPDVGTEVLVAFTGGEGVEGDAIIVGVLPSGDTPVGLAPGQVLVASDNILLVSADAAENFVLGQKLKTLLVKLYQLLISHNHQGIVASSPPVNAADLTAELAKIQAEGWLSQKVKGK